MLLGAGGGREGDGGGLRWGKASLNPQEEHKNDFSMWSICKARHFSEEWCTLSAPDARRWQGGVIRAPKSVNVLLCVSAATFRERCSRFISLCPSSVPIQSVSTAPALYAVSTCTQTISTSRLSMCSLQSAAPSATGCWFLLHSILVSLLSLERWKNSNTCNSKWWTQNPNCNFYLHCPVDLIFLFMQARSRIRKNVKAFRINVLIV